MPRSGPLTTAPHDATARAAWAGGGAGPVSPQELNRYSYAGNNPVRNTDPTGHFTCFLLCPLGAAAGSVAGPAGTAVGGAVGSAGDALLLAAAALVVAAVANLSEDLNSAGSIPGSVGGAEGLPSGEADGVEGQGKLGKQGTFDGERAGKPFTPKGKQQVIDANREAHEGRVICEKCDIETVPSQKSAKGVTPAPNEAQVDHIHPQSRGGDGSASNGQVLCRVCNRDKSNKIE